MKQSAVWIAVAALMLSSAAYGDDGQGKSSGGIFGWLVDAVSGSQSAGQSVDAKEAAPEPQQAAKSTDAEPTPMAVTEDSTNDKEAYKPDAGEAPQ